MRLMEDGELFSEADREAEELMRLMEDGERFSEADRGAEESMRLLEDGKEMNCFEAEQVVRVESDCMGDTDPLFKAADF